MKDQNRKLSLTRAVTLEILNEEAIIIREIRSVIESSYPLGLLILSLESMRLHINFFVFHIQKHKTPK